ncbi:HSP20-like chaperone [Aspergillus ellipticus CBS 707.79]|uniref:HSP20-like chaperone n=1 Tax=Aspergillus ellipticus CBS 707.79 TaxID=1448320 RepID=A0A319DKB1_9EURO|nr:HSP20-like chaperone [Aspergillus ellipticus CBS 707.79]
MSLPQVHPEVTWAQRSSASDVERNYLYVNIKAADVPKSAASLDLKSNTVTFTGDSKKGVKYHVELELFGEIDPENSKVNHSDREVELVLRKKELKEEFWPRLLKTTQKIHFLKTDFDKWVDEDEQDDAPEEDYANNFGGFEGMGGDAGGLSNIDFSKLGGAGGLGDLAGGAGFGGAEEEEDDEEMPELEEEGQSKIQEVS